MERRICELESAQDDDLEKIANLKEENKRLTHELWRERKASNSLIADAISEAREVMARALTIESTAHDAEVQSKSCTDSAVRKERAHHSCVSRSAKKRHGAAVAKLEKEIKSLSGAKERLTREIASWRKRLANLELKSKLDLKAEREKRRRMVQEQLEQTNAVEDELCLYIVVLDKMRTQMEE